VDRTTLAGLLALTLAGGLIGSLGIPILLRSQRLRSRVIRWKWWGVVLYCCTVAAAIAGVVAWVYQTVVKDGGAAGSLDSPWLYLAVGVAAGLPFSLSTILTVRRRAKEAEERKRRRKAKPASRQERVTFAQDLERQLRDYSDDLHDAKVTVRGDKGTVIAIRGNLAREQAERLVNLLRADLEDLGIQRIESADKERNWWVRV